MKFLTSLFIFFISIACLAADTTYSSTEEKIRKIINEKGGCSFFYSVSAPSPVRIGANPEVLVCYLTISGNDDLVSFVQSNKSKAIPVLMRLLEDEKFDWIANLLLYQITNTPAWNMQLFQPNKCEKWKMEQKKECIEFWRQKFK